MNPIKFKIAAKTDVGRVRENNEDNFQAASDLAVAPMRWINDKECTLGSKGALLVVADGMGGMNAGEVASEIAIDTLRAYFSPEQITDEVVKTRYTIERFMKNAIVEADNRIKKTAAERPETHGMGTTVVVGWIFDGYLYVSWCGDSRAYVYNPAYGLRQITKDHSYVQDLVDRGAIPPEDAFDYPDNNIITRSLSDAGTKARPDCLLMPHELCDGDIILLCTDGLSGMIRDYEIQEVIEANSGNMDQCADALIQAACEASGHDNITVALCQILSGGKQAERMPLHQLSPLRQKEGTTEEGIPAASKPNRWRWVWGIGIVAVCLLVGASAGFYVGRTAQRPAVDGEDSIPDCRQDSIDIKIPQEKENEPLATPQEPGASQEPAASGGHATTEQSVATEKPDAGNKKAKGKDSAPAVDKAKKDKPSEGDTSEPKSNDPNRLTPVKEDRQTKEATEELTPVSNEGETDLSAIPETSATANDTVFIHIVKAKEGVAAIAKKYGVTQDEIIELNNLKKPYTLQLNQKLKIPQKKK